MSLAAAPIVILAAPGVPAATLAAALGNHPEAMGLPECGLPLAALVDEAIIEMTGLRASQMHGTLRALAHLLSGEQTGASVAMARRWLARRAHLPTQAALREILALAAPLRPVLPLGGTLGHALARRRVAEAAPGALVVHLTAGEGALWHCLRDPRAAAAAILSVEGAERSVAPPPAKVLEAAAAGIADLAARLGGTIRTVAIEDLAADPEATLDGLAVELGLAPGEGARMIRPEDSPFAGPGPFGAHLSGEVLSMAALRRRLRLTVEA